MSKYLIQHVLQKKIKNKTVDLEPTINFTFQIPKITNTWEKVEKL
jgi:hypothetical protein